MKTCILIIAFVTLYTVAPAQTYNLHQLVKKNKLTPSKAMPKPFTDGGRKAVASSRITWITGKNFTTGTIDIDLRGKDELQNSFVGIAFHAIDTNTYDAVYFRPFNFRAENNERRIHAVQYMSVPDFDWQRLRTEQNGIYEKAVTPAPDPNDWFHARIVVTTKEIIVFVNNATEPSLTVTKLNTRTSGHIGLWSNGLPGHFANLTITPD